MLHRRNTSFKATIIYRTVNTECFDLAVLKCDRQNIEAMQDVAICVKPMKKGKYTDLIRPGALKIAKFVKQKFYSLLSHCKS